jgi:antitoxin VapB
MLIIHAQNTHFFVHTLAMSHQTTRVFINGNSQAVRIPAEFRLDTDQVQIFRNEEGDLVLHAVVAQRSAALLAALEGFDEAFITALETERAEPLQDREAL